MGAQQAGKDECVVCHRRLPVAALRDSGTLNAGIAALLGAELPDWHGEGMICREDLARFRRVYLEHLLEGERGELSQLHREVIDSLETGAPLAEDIETAFEQQRSFGARAADLVATFGGSWTFILLFLLVLVIWMAINASRFLGASFDPYPFILLNLVLSCVAAIQAPIIMMSQRRTEAKDRLRAENDYKVNLKAELEIRHLHEKFDHQLARQWARLAEIQRIQIEMLEEAAREAHAAVRQDRPQSGRR